MTARKRKSIDAPRVWPPLPRYFLLVRRASSASSPQELYDTFFVNNTDAPVRSLELSLDGVLHLTEEMIQSASSPPRALGEVPPHGEIAVLNGNRAMSDYQHFFRLTFEADGEHQNHSANLWLECMGMPDTETIHGRVAHADGWVVRFG